MIEFRIVTSTRDIEEVARLAQEIWNDHYVDIIGQAQVDYMVSKFQSAEAIAEQIAGGFEYYLIVHDGEESGYIAVAAEHGTSFLLLSKIYVRKDSRGLGLGKAAVCLAEEICRKRGLRSIRLTVNRHNVRSISWYERMGFVNAGEAVKDIGAGFVMDDFVMEKKV